MCIRILHYIINATRNAPLNLPLNKRQRDKSRSLIYLQHVAFWSQEDVCVTTCSIKLDCVHVHSHFSLSPCLRGLLDDKINRLFTNVPNFPHAHFLLNALGVDLSVRCRKKRAILSLPIGNPRYRTHSFVQGNKVNTY